MRRVRTPWRSTLLVSGSLPVDDLVGTVAETGADRVILDLDDTVPAREKADARERVTHALAELRTGGRSVSVRVNAPDHPNCARDLAALLTGDGAEAVASVCVPRPSDERMIWAVDWTLGQLERETRGGRVALETQLETPAGLCRGSELLAASPRMMAVTFGHGDFADAMELPFLAPGDDSALAPHVTRAGELALFHLRLAAGAADVVALDGPHPEASAYADRWAYARGLGFHGAWCVTEEQVAVANEVFAPQPAELALARSVLSATDDGHAAPDGPGSYDAPRVNAARRIVAAVDGAGRVAGGDLAVER